MIVTYHWHHYRTGSGKVKVYFWLHADMASTLYNGCRKEIGGWDHYSYDQLSTQQIEHTACDFHLQQLSQ